MRFATYATFTPRTPIVGNSLKYSASLPLVLSFLLQQIKMQNFQVFSNILPELAKGYCEVLLLELLQYLSGGAYHENYLLQLKLV